MPEPTRTSQPLAPAEISPPVVGQLPAALGRYQILGALGRGGMAEVFLARFVGPGGVEKRVCVKRVLPALAADPRASRRFADEARTALSLQHANIVPVFDFGRDGQDLYLVMEWIDGGDLGRVLSSRGALSPLQAAYVAEEIARALVYAHDPRRAGGGLVHSDVTPRNVLISRLGEVRLTDFGVARVAGAAGGLAGTPRYMSPEQARGEPPRPADDLYALGLILAEMIDGRPVRVTNSVEASGQPVTAPALAGAPEDLRELTAAMLAPDPAARPADAAQVQGRLARILADAVLRGDPDPAQELAARVAEVAASSPAPGVTRAPPPTMAGPTIAARTVEEAGDTSWRTAVLIGTAVAALVGAGWTIARGRLHRPDAATPAPVIPSAAPAISAPLLAAPPIAPAEAPPPAAPTQHRLAPASALLEIRAPGSWVAVFVDGRRISDDAGRFPIPAGRHHLRVENQPLGFSRAETIQVRAGETVLRVYHPDQPP